MGTWTTLLLTLIALFLLYSLYQGIRNNPHAFSKTALLQSAYTLGVLAVILMAFIGLCVFFLRA